MCAFCCMLYVVMFVEVPADDTTGLWRPTVDTGTYAAREQKQTKKERTHAAHRSTPTTHSTNMHIRKTGATSPSPAPHLPPFASAPSHIRLPTDGAAHVVSLRSVSGCHPHVHGIRNCPSIAGMTTITIKGEGFGMRNTHAPHATDATPAQHSAAT